MTLPWITKIVQKLPLSSREASDPKVDKHSTHLVMQDQVETLKSVAEKSYAPTASHFHWPNM